MIATDEFTLFVVADNIFNFVYGFIIIMTDRLIGCCAGACTVWAALTFVVVIVKDSYFIAIIISDETCGIIAVFISSCSTSLMVGKFHRWSFFTLAFYVSLRLARLACCFAASMLALATVPVLGVPV